jgi:hypothetical protein
MGVRVRTNRHGYLFLRIFWKGRDVWVGVKERDDGPRGKNRTLIEAKTRLITEELRKGTPLHLALINVLGDCPPGLVPMHERVPPGEDVTVGEAAEEWFCSLKAKRRRKSLLDKTRYYLDGVILPTWKNVRLEDVTAARVERFQTAILARTRTRRNRDTGELENLPIRVKTARNIVGGHFRALIMWCRRIYRLPSDNPFDGIQWTRESRPEPDPFAPADRALLLELFRTQKPFWFP